jgi:hypothetical protein
MIFKALRAPKNDARHVIRALILPSANQNPNDVAFGDVIP